MEKVPSTPVTVPLVVPFSRILTPGKADPSSPEVTVPVTFVWAAARLQLSSRRKKAHDFNR
jgi:hypothetical protein